MGGQTLQQRAVHVTFRRDEHPTTLKVTQDIGPIGVINRQVNSVRCSKWCELKFMFGYFTEIEPSSRASVDKAVGMPTVVAIAEGPAG